MTTTTSNVPPAAAIPSPDLPPMVTVGDLSDYLKVHDRTVRRWLAEKRLRYVKVGGAVRIRREEVARFLAGGDS